MKKPFKDFLFFSRGERRGILLLLALVVLVLLGGQGYDWLARKSSFSPEDLRRQALALREYEAFAASVRQQPRPVPEWKRYEEERQGRPQPVLFPFNPNRADSADFCRLGLPGWMARNIVRYREKGGRFRKVEDFRKVYGLTDGQFAALSPYIRLAHEDTLRDVPRLYFSRPQADTSAVTGKPRKYPPGTVVDLNRADTAELKKIPGIGSGIARLIVGYRQRLGGYYELRQLEEIRLDYRLLEDWLFVDTAAITRIPVNRAGVGRLRAHPYINFYQAKALVEYRKKRGDLRNLKPFALYEEFSARDLERIGHYLRYD